MITEFEKLKDLIKFEGKHGLWDLTFKGCRIWYFLRPHYLKNETLTPPSTYFSFKGILNSLQGYIKYCRSQKVSLHLFMNRPELIEFFKRDNSCCKILFYTPSVSERKIHHKNAYCADFFNIIRFLLRKTAFVFYLYRYAGMKNEIQKRTGERLHGKRLNALRTAIGDALWLGLLKCFFMKSGQKTYYSGCFVPLCEKFQNHLNSAEIQHGVITGEHFLYNGLPPVKNTLVCYLGFYRDFLKQNGYKGKITTNHYKLRYLFHKMRKKPQRLFCHGVFFTQPQPGVARTIENFFLTYKPQNVFIQKHPNDTYPYKLEKKFFVKNISPREINWGAAYYSTVIEELILTGRQAVIWDMGIIDIEPFIKHYKGMTKHIGRGNVIVVKTSEDFAELMKSQV